MVQFPKLARGTYALYWILWLVLFTLVWRIYAAESRLLADKADALANVFGSITRTYSQGHIDSRYTLNELLTTGRQAIGAEHLPPLLQDRVTNYLAELKSDPGRGNRAATFVREAVKIYLQGARSENKICVNFDRLFWLLLCAVVFYQFAVLATVTYLKRNGNYDSTYPKVNSFFNALDLSIIAAITPLFFLDEHAGTYWICLCFFIHMMIFGLTLSKSEEEWKDPNIVAIRCAYVISFLMPVAVSSIVIESLTFLWIALLAILSSAIVGFLLGLHPGMTFLMSQYLPSVSSGQQKQKGEE